MDTHKTVKTVFADTTEISGMSSADIESVLEILRENKLENWNFADFADEIQRNDSIVLTAREKGRTVGFCVARLIMAGGIGLSDTSRKVNSEIKDIVCEVEKNIRPQAAESYSRSNTSSSSFSDSASTGGFIENSHDGEIYNIAVKKEFQNRGIGQSLLDELITLARNRNTEAIWLEVRSSNVRAIDFYQKNNFIKVYERKNFYTNPSEDAFVLKRNLSPEFI